jgi:hypothetical protein
MSSGPPRPPPKKQPEKKQVVGEVWDDVRVKEFLAQPVVEGRGDADFVRLLRAYQGMRPQDFERYLGFFVEAGHNVDARNEHNQTLIAYISRHRLSGPFVEALLRAGAQPLTSDR